MSETDEGYTIVEELEEGEIVEPDVNSHPKKRKHKSSLPRRYAWCETEDLKHEAQPKNGLKRTHKSTNNSVVSQLPPSTRHKPTFIESNKVVHSEQFIAAHKSALNTSRSPQKKTDNRMLVESRTIHHQRFATPIERSFRSAEVSVREKEPSKNESERSSYLQLDINTSYDDLLKHHKLIQKELARLEKEHRPKKKCIHKQKKRSSLDESKVIDTKKSKLDPKSISSSNKSNIKSNSHNRKVTVKEKSSVKVDSCRNEKSPPKTKSLVEADKPLNIKCAKPIDVEEDEELIQLRLNALASRVAKAPSSTDSSQLVDNPAAQVGCNKENTEPNSISISGSSAFSVALNDDNYSVLDMEESDNDSKANPCLIDISSSPSPPVAPHPAPSNNNEEEEDPEIVLLRAQVLQSLGKKLKEQNEPDSTTSGIGVDGRDVIVLSDDQSSTDPEDLATGVSVLRNTDISSPSSVVSESVTVPVDPGPTPEPCSSSGGGDKAVQVPKVTVSVPNHFCNPKYQAPVNNTRKADQHIWRFIKQDPVIINLADDSSEESSDESDSSGVDTPDALTSLTKLIDDERNKPSESKNIEASYVEVNTKTSNNVELVGTSAVEQSSSTTVQNKNADLFQKTNTEQNKIQVNKSLANAYNLLQKKLSLASLTLKKEQQVLTMTRMHANKKKAAFITSQVEAQRLREQLVAAERVKNTNMRMMFCANAQLETVQKSIDKRETLIRDLQEECIRFEALLSSRVPSPS